MLKIGLLCKLRHDDRPEEEIAAKPKFGSVEAMHTQLGNWGLPGLLPKKAEEASRQPKRRKPKAGSREAGTELPCPVAATALFEEAVDALHRLIEDLEHYRLTREGGRFISTYVDNHIAAYFLRASFTPEQWREMCESHGQDANSEGFTLLDAGIKNPTGGGRYPPRFLVILIAVYALLGRDMPALI